MRSHLRKFTSAGRSTRAVVHGFVGICKFTPYVVFEENEIGVEIGDYGTLPKIARNVEMALICEVCYKLNGHGLRGRSDDLHNAPKTKPQP